MAGPSANEIRRAIGDAYFYHRSKGRPARRALTYAQADVATGRYRYPGTYPNSLPVYGWGNKRASDGSIWIERLDAAGLRFVGYADEIASIRHKGWYTSDDNIRDEALRGVVVRMQAVGGTPRFLAAYEDPNNSGTYRIDPSWIHIGTSYEGEAERECARAADAFAERCAEEERDYNRAWQAGRHFEELGEEVKATRRKLLALIAEARASCKQKAFGPLVRETLGKAIEEGLETIRKARADRADLFANFSRQPGFEG